jgi:phosphohistidine swiveling domain-containing protein
VENQTLFLNTPQQILALLTSRPDEEFYINELIRLTGRFPNSVEHALAALEKKALVQSVRIGNRKFYKAASSLSAPDKTMFFKKDALDWVKVANRETSFAFNNEVCLANITSLKDIYGVALTDFWYNGVTFAVYDSRSELENLGRVISGKLEANPDFAFQDTARCKKACDVLVRTAKQISATETKSARPSTIQRLRKFLQAYRFAFAFISVPHAIERYFEVKIREQVRDDRYLEVLLSPVSTFDEERDSALELAGYVKKNGYSREYKKRLAEHAKKYCWLPLWSLTAPPFSEEYFHREIENILQRIAEPIKEKARLRHEDMLRQQRVEKVLRIIKAPDALRRHVHLLQEYIGLRTYRKNTICQAHYYHLPFLRHIGKLIGLDGNEMTWVTYDEMLEALEQKVSAAELKRRIKERKGGWGILMWNGKISLIAGAKRVVQTIEQYRITSPVKSRVITGRTASRGRVVGRVRIVHKLSELTKVVKGDILVARMTTPDYMIAINRCVGIITDEGGATCHAAIVSREFGIPCIVGTHVATKELNDNDLVELNATAGTARIVERGIAEQQGEVRGKTAYPGKVKGKAVVVLGTADLDKVRSGDILVTSQVTPDYLSTLYRIGGMILDEDSITGHGILYAKALRIPTVYGTGQMRLMLNDSDLIELNAAIGKVTKLT